MEFVNDGIVVLFDVDYLTWHDGIVGRTVIRVKKKPALSKKEPAQDLT